MIPGALVLLIVGLVLLLATTYHVLGLVLVVIGAVLLVAPLGYGRRRL